MTTPSPSQTRVNCLPTYIVIDTSSSMSKVEDLLNETIENLYDSLITSPRISEFAHVSLISFNTDARVVLEMTDIESIDYLPRLECNGVTNFSRAFQVLRERIDVDVAQLTAMGREVLRPAAFVLTDGQPTDSDGRLTTAWRSEFDRLTDSGWRRHPHVIPFGFGDATATVLRDMATVNGSAFLAQDSGNNEALHKIFTTLLNTLVSSAQHNELRLPTSVDGFIRVSKDIID